MANPACKVYLHAAGGLACDGEPINGARAAVKRVADALPLGMRALGKSLHLTLPRLASRHSQLAVIGARLAVDTLANPLAADSPVYLASGLGEVARTDALYYQVMPPRREMASPAQFATSGNNMAAFFVAQQLGLTSRNFTVSQGDVSLEYAFALALDDLRAGAASQALVGAVDETTLPREFYVRRYPRSADAPIGEGSAWFVLGVKPQGAIAELVDVAWLRGAPDDTPDDWARRIADYAYGIATDPALWWMPGNQLSASQIAALAVQLNVSALANYQDWTGCYPTAAAAGMAHTLLAPASRHRSYLHVNADARGRWVLMLWQTK